MAETLLLFALLLSIASWDAVNGCCSYYSSSTDPNLKYAYTVLGFVLTFGLTLCCYCCCQVGRESTTDTENNTAGNLAVIYTNTAAEENASEYPQESHTSYTQNTYNEQPGATPSEYQPPPSYHQTQEALPSSYQPPPSYHQTQEALPSRNQPSPSYSQMRAANLSRYQSPPPYQEYQTSIYV